MGKLKSAWLDSIEDAEYLYLESFNDDPNSETQNSTEQHWKTTSPAWYQLLPIDEELPF